MSQNQATHFCLWEDPMRGLVERLDDPEQLEAYVIHYERDGLNIDTASQDVGGDEYLGSSGPKLVNDSIAMVSIEGAR
jgi:hypothetical protein